MARTNRECAAWVARLLEVRPDDKVLEVGFGPGTGIEFLARAALRGFVAGVDPSKEMVAQASARNAEAIANGRVDLRLGSAESLPFAANTFDKTMAINSLQIWPDAIAGLREISRVLRSGGEIALGFTPHSGRQKAGISELLAAAGFSNVRLVERERDFCEVAAKP
jgi:ubiquinone/menaquinone biosynthesis C-methylase UbiE